MRRIFDLHCDTISEIYKSKESLLSNTRAVSIDKFSDFSKKAQVFAIWSDNEKNEDEAFVTFQHTATELKAQLEENSSLAALCTSKEELESAQNEGKLSAILAVEDAKLLGGDISRLERLRNFGVRILTLGWKGHSCVCGSYDTDEGLTEFGFEVLRECENLGIIVDVSHLSEKAFWDVAGKAQKPFIASHSNSHIICDHRRNITDVQLRTIVSAGGLCGINLVGKHLAKRLPGEKALDPAEVLDAVCAHIEHFSSIAPESICLGLDLDGTEPLAGLESVDKTPTLFEALTNRGMDEKRADDIFYNNAYNFFLKNL
ncbi:MAG: membrane dipeptidase [Clostridia bacterium]|nr:membrane dipeptidase [Clostridia bacterium]